MKPKKPELNKKDSIEETLICEICQVKAYTCYLVLFYLFLQEILHDCVRSVLVQYNSNSLLHYSLQPCTHTYCAGCYSEWMEYSRECPAVRKSFVLSRV